MRAWHASHSVESSDWRSMLNLNTGAIYTARERPPTTRAAIAPRSVVAPCGLLGAAPHVRQHDIGAARVVLATPIQQRGDVALDDGRPSRWRRAGPHRILERHLPNVVDGVRELSADERPRVDVGALVEVALGARRQLLAAAGLGDPADAAALELARAGEA